MDQCAQVRDRYFIPAKIKDLGQNQVMWLFNCLPETENEWNGGEFLDHNHTNDGLKETLTLTNQYTRRSSIFDFCKGFHWFFFSYSFF